MRKPAPARAEAVSSASARSSSWKAEERRVARLLGGSRRGPSGRETEDVSHPLFSVEVKQRRDIPAWFLAAIQQARDNAPADKIPLVVLHKAATRERVVCLSMAAFLALCRHFKIVPGDSLDTFGDDTTLNCSSPDDSAGAGD